MNLHLTKNELAAQIQIKNLEYESGARLVSSALDVRCFVSVKVASNNENKLQHNISKPSFCRYY